MATSIIACSTLSSAGDVVSLFETSFEPFPTEDPGYTLGPIAGQNGWITIPNDTDSNVQDAVVTDGVQALEVIDGPGVARAQHSVIHDLEGELILCRVDMFVPLAWGDNMNRQRFEAMAGLRFLIPGGDSLVVDFGLIKTDDPYDTVPADTTAWAIKLLDGAQVLSSVYVPVEFEDYADSWVRFRLEYDRVRRELRLFIGRDLQSRLPLGSLEFLGLRDVRLHNRRIGTNDKANDQPVYFDLLRVRENTDIGVSDPVLPTSFERVRGLPGSGGLEDLFVDDDARLITRPDVFEPTNIPPVQIQVDSELPVTDPSELLFLIESRPDVANIRQRVLLFNFDTQLYEVVDDRVNPEDIDTPLIISIVDDPGRFINDDDGAVRALAQYNAIAFSILPTWTVGLDRTLWLYVE